jgi:hypothetical protein
MILLLILAVLVCGYYGYVFARARAELAFSQALVDVAAACQKFVAPVATLFRKLVGLVKK